MVNVKWCCKQSSGIKLVSPSDNLAQSYLKMAENAIGTMNREKEYNLQFSVSACYYSMYYSLYAVLMKLGVKCEIHSCTIEFAKQLLGNFYSPEEVKTIRKAFEIREITQYYADRIVNENDVDFIMSQAPAFFNKSKSVLARLNETDVKKIREELEKVCNKSD